MKKLLLLPLILINLLTHAQSTDWRLYANGKNITALAEIGTKIWAGTDLGLVSIDTVTGQTNFFNTCTGGPINNSINCIAGGIDGEVWVGSGSWDSAGLSRYDGNTWTHYTTGNSGLCQNFVRALLVEDDGTVWIGTRWGMSVFRSGIWTTYGLQSGLPDPRITSLDMDSLGNLWIGTEGGLGKFNGIATWTEWNEYNSGLPDNEIHDLAFADDGVLWIATSSGVASFDGIEFITYNNLNSGIYNHVNTVDTDSRGYVWAGTGLESYYGGLYKFDGTLWTAYHDYNSGLTSEYVPDVLVDAHNNLWAGTLSECYYEGGLVKFDGSEWTAYNTSIAQLSCNTITALAFSDSSTTWIGSYGSLMKYDGYNWETYNQNNSLLPGSVYSMAVDSLQRIWIGTSGGLALFNGTSWHIYSENNSGLPDNYIHDLEFDQNGILWVGTDNGMAKFDGTDWTVYDTSTSGLPDPTVHSLLPDNQGNVWVYSQLGEVGNRSLSKFDGNTWTTWNRDNSSFGMAVVNDMETGPEGDLWMATDGTGLVHFNGTDFIEYNVGNSGIADDWLKTLEIDEHGHFWIGGSEGMNEYDGFNWTLYTDGNSPLAYNYIHVIAIDSFGNKWIGTDNGLSEYNQNGIPVNVRNISPPGNRLLIYPNPVTDRLHLNLPPGRKTLQTEIINIQGAVVKQFHGSEPVDVSSLPKGIYCVRVLTQNGCLNAKFIKQAD